MPYEHTGGARESAPCFLFHDGFQHPGYVLPQPPDVQAALERKALDSKMTLTDFLATKINEIVREGSPASSLVDEIEHEEFSEDKD